MILALVFQARPLPPNSMSSTQVRTTTETKDDGTVILTRSAAEDYAVRDSVHDDEEHEAANREKELETKKAGDEGESQLVPVEEANTCSI